MHSSLEINPTFSKNYALAIVKFFCDVERDKNPIF